MSNTQTKVRPGPSGTVNSGMPLEPNPEPAPRNPRQDFIFAVKLFGIAGLIVLAIWLMDRFV